MSTLPAPFAAFGPFVAQWARPGLAERAAARSAASAGELQAFYTAGQPLISALLDRLDNGPADPVLHSLALAWVHAALAVELQGEAEPFNARSREHMAITREAFTP